MTIDEIKREIREDTISETHHRLSFDAREAEARRADAEAERDRLKDELSVWHIEKAVFEKELARLQKQVESWRLVYDKDSQPFDSTLRAALLHLLAQYDGDEYREVLSGFAARLREQS